MLRGSLQTTNPPASPAPRPHPTSWRINHTTPSFQEGDASADFAAAPPPPRPRQTQHGLGVCLWRHLVNGTGNSLSPGQPTPGVVKQDKSSGGSVDTTKTRSGPQRVRMSSGERPIGAAKGKQPNTEALCQPPPLAQQHHPLAQTAQRGPVAPRLLGALAVSRGRCWFQ